MEDKKKTQKAELKREKQNGQSAKSRKRRKNGMTKENAASVKIRKQKNVQKQGKKEQVMPVQQYKKQTWKPGTMVYPVPAVMVSCQDKQGNSNIITVAWTGTVNSDPAMAYISVRPERHSYHIIKESGEFVINLTTEALCSATDYCGVRSGRDVDKWKECGLTKAPASKVSAPLIAESPVNIECRVKEVVSLGSHDMFLAEVLAVDVSEAYLDETGKFDMEACKLVSYSHGTYYGLGKKLGTFGYTVRKKR